MTKVNKNRACIYSVEALDSFSNRATEMNIVISILDESGAYLDLLPELIERHLGIYRTIYTNQTLLWSMKDKSGKVFDLSFIESNEKIYITDIVESPETRLKHFNYLIHKDNLQINVH